MLIDNQKLDFSEFKNFYKEMDWVRVPRTLGPNHSEFFYVGIWENDDRKINIQIRSSMRMKVSESFKNCDRNGKLMSKEDKGERFNFGTTVEVVIDDTVLDKIKEVAKIKKEDGKQKVSW